MNKRYTMLAAAALLAAGSVPAYAKASVTKQQIEAAHAKCLKAYAYFNINTKEQLRTFMRVSKERAPEVFCQRVIKAVLEGRLDRGDLTRLQHDGSTRLFLILRGK